MIHIFDNDDTARLSGIDHALQGIDRITQVGEEEPCIDQIIFGFIVEVINV